MSRKQLLADMTAILTALHDTHPEPAPMSSLYLAFDCDMDRYQLTVDILKRGELVTTGRPAHTLVLTTQGWDKAIELKAILAQHGVA